MLSSTMLGAARRTSFSRLSTSCPLRACSGECFADKGGDGYAIPLVIEQVNAHLTETRETFFGDIEINRGPVELDGQIENRDEDTEQGHHGANDRSAMVASPSAGAPG